MKYDSDYSAAMDCAVRVLQMAAANDKGAAIRDTAESAAKFLQSEFERWTGAEHDDEEAEEPANDETVVDEGECR